MKATDPWKRKRFMHDCIFCLKRHYTYPGKGCPCLLKLMARKRSIVSV